MIKNKKGCGDEGVFFFIGMFVMFIICVLIAFAVWGDGYEDGYCAGLYYDNETESYDYFQYDEGICKGYRRDRGYTVVENETILDFKQREWMNKGK